MNESVKFIDAVLAIWTPELEVKYPTLAEFMASPEALELRKRYWAQEAQRRGEINGGG